MYVLKSCNSLQMHDVVYAESIVNPVKHCFRQNLYSSFLLTKFIPIFVLHATSVKQLWNEKALS